MVKLRCSPNQVRFLFAALLNNQPFKIIRVLDGFIKPPDVFCRFLFRIRMQAGFIADQSQNGGFLCDEELACVLERTVLPAVATVQARGHGPDR